VRYTKITCFFREEAMKFIEVWLHSSLRKYYPNPGNGEALTITMEDEAKLGSLFDELKIPKEKITVVLVNGKHEEESYLLQNGDRIAILPLISGG